MSSQFTLKIPVEQAKEMPMVDLAFLVLKAANTPFYYRDLMMEIAKIKGFSDDEVMNVIAQLYTEINVDGRFACVGNNLWGLKRWYPVDNKTDDAVGSGKRPRIINDEDDDLDEDDSFAEEEEIFTGDEDFDTYDEDRELLPDDEKEEEDEEFYEEDEGGELSDEDEDEESDDLEEESEDEEEDYDYDGDDNER